MGSEFSYFVEFQPSKSAIIKKKSKFKASKHVKMADFALLKSPKVNFTSILSDRKIMKFSHCDR